jgi:hypothetical protein
MDLRKSYRKNFSVDPRIENTQSAFSPGHVVWNERTIDKYWSICNLRYCPVMYLDILTETKKHPLRIAMTWPKF